MEGVGRAAVSAQMLSQHKQGVWELVAVSLKEEVTRWREQGRG